MMGWGGLSTIEWVERIKEGSEPVVVSVRHPEQTTTFPAPVEATSGPMTLLLRVSVAKKPRQRCSACDIRRVCYVIAVGDLMASDPMCAKCAGFR